MPGEGTIAQYPPPATGKKALRGQKYDPRMPITKQVRSGIRPASGYRTAGMLIVIVWRARFRFPLRI